MKHLLSIPLLFLALVANAAHVQFDYYDLVNSVDFFAASTNVVMRIKYNDAPTVYNGRIIVKDWRSWTNGADGSLTVSNLVPGRHVVTLTAKNSETSFNILVPDTNALVLASSLTFTPTNTITTGTGVAYSAASSDARYIIKYGTPTNGQVLTWDGSSSRYYPSNSAGSASGTTYSANTNQISLAGNTVSILPNALLTNTIVITQLVVTGPSGSMTFRQSGTDSTWSGGSEDWLRYDSAIGELWLAGNTKISASYAGKVPIYNNDGNFRASSVSNSELAYLSGVTQAVQTQINGKIASSGGRGTNNIFTNPTIADTVNFQDSSGNDKIQMAAGADGSLVWTELSSPSDILKYDGSSQVWRFYYPIQDPTLYGTVTSTNLDARFGNRVEMTNGFGRNWTNFGTLTMGTNSELSQVPGNAIAIRQTSATVGNTNILEIRETDGTLLASFGVRTNSAGGRGWLSLINPYNEGNGSGIRFLSTNKFGQFQMDNGGNYIFRNNTNGTGASMFFDYAAGGVKFRNSGLTEKARMTDSGLFGINTNSPQAMLHVHGDTLIVSNLTVGGILYGNGSGLTNVPGGSADGGITNLTGINNKAAGDIFYLSSPTQITNLARPASDFAGLSINTNGFPVWEDEGDTQYINDAFYSGASIYGAMTANLTAQGGVSQISSTTLPTGFTNTGFWLMQSFPTNTSSRGFIQWYAVATPRIVWQSNATLNASLIMASSGDFTNMQVSAGLHATAALTPTDAVRGFYRGDWHSNIIFHTANNSQNTYVTSTIPVLQNTRYDIAMRGGLNGFDCYINGAAATNISGGLIFISSTIPTNKVMTPMVLNNATVNTGTATANSAWLDKFQFRGK